MVSILSPAALALKNPLSLGILIVLALPGIGYAERWQIAPSVELEERYDDNITLSSTNEESSLGSFLKGSLTFSRLTEISTIEGRLSAEYSHYSDAPASVNNDNTNIYFDFNSEFRTELSRYGILGLIRRDTTLRFADSLEADNPDVIEDPDAPVTVTPGIDDSLDLDRGLVQEEIDRETLALSPYWGFDLDERSSIDFRYRYTDVNYKDNPSGSGVFDYESHDISTVYEYQVNERDKVGMGVTAGRFKSPDNSNNTVDTYSIKGLYNRKFTETLDGEVEIGVNRYKQESDLSTTSVETDGILFGLSLNKRTETGRYGISISRNIQPSGDGSVSETNQINLRGRQALSERLAILASLSVAETDRVGATSRKREYLFFNPRLEWKMTQEWALGFGYRYIRNDESSSQTADSNSVSFSLKYTEPYFLE